MATMEGPVGGSVSAVSASSSMSNASSGKSATSGQSTSSNAKWKGRVLKRFKLIDLLGQGSMGKVFRAEDITLRRYVALKVLPTKTRDGQRDHKIDQFVREARSGANIEHPNAVTVYEIGESAGVHYIAMELVEGGNLERLVRASGPMEIERACQITAEAAEALSAAHAMGIIHRDVKPSNLLLSRNGRCKLADFGLARYEDPEDSTAVRGECVGTPCYIAPELPLGQKATPQSDIYSLGCALWYLLTGKPPFEARTKHDMMKMHVYAALPDLRELRPDVPPRLAEAIVKACAKNPSDRYETADQFAKVLRTFTIPTPSGLGSSRRLQPLGASAQNVPTLGGGASATAGTHASGSLPAWSPDASPSASSVTVASSVNLAPTMQSTAQLGGSFAGTNASFTGNGEAAAASGVYGSQQGLPPKRRLPPAPILWAGIGTVATVCLIGLGVWIARGGSSSTGPAPAVASPGSPGSAAAPAAGDAARAATVLSPKNIVNNSALQVADDTDGLQGWFIHEKYQPSVTFPDERGNRFVRIVAQAVGDTPHVDQKIDLDPTWTRITVSARMRVSGFKAGSKGDARVALEFWDANEKGLGAPASVPRLRTDSGWTELRETVRIPTGAASMHLKLSVSNAVGTVDFDDVQVIPHTGN